MTLDDILKHPKHIDFFKVYGYVKYTGAESKTHKVKPTVTLMLPVTLTPDELSDMFNEWKDTL
jgi:hypothetical protein